MRDGLKVLLLETKELKPIQTVQNKLREREHDVKDYIDKYKRSKIGLVCNKIYIHYNVLNNSENLYDQNNQKFTQLLCEDYDLIVLMTDSGFGAHVDERTHKFLKETKSKVVLGYWRSCNGKESSKELKLYEVVDIKGSFSGFVDSVFIQGISGTFLDVEKDLNNFCTGENEKGYSVAHDVIPVNPLDLPSGGLYYMDYGYQPKINNLLFLLR